MIPCPKLSIMDFDFHTHRLDITPGTGIVALPQSMVSRPASFSPHPDGLYAAGIHPWWTSDADFSLSHYIEALSQLLSLPQVVEVGECGFDRLRGASMERQMEIFAAQVELSETFGKGMTLHVVRAFDLVLSARKQLRPTQRWTVHGFRGNPTLAQQLLSAGFDLSFGIHRNAEAWALTPPERRHEETDAELCPII